MLSENRTEYRDLCCTAVLLLSAEHFFYKRGTVVQSIVSCLVGREPLPFLGLIYADSKILVTAAGRISVYSYHFVPF
jgi:hypothetical protein